MNVTVNVTVFVVFVSILVPIATGMDTHSVPLFVQTDRCVATLVQVRRTLGDVSLVAGAAGSCARAALLAYRVLAPRLVLRALPCKGDKRRDCECNC